MTDLRLLPAMGGVLVLGSLALAGEARAAAPHSLAAVPATFPTYTYASF
jgi:hypothetical protein